MTREGARPARAASALTLSGAGDAPTRRCSARGGPARLRSSPKACSHAPVSVCRRTDGAHVGACCARQGKTRDGSALARIPGASRILRRAGRSPAASRAKEAIVQRPSNRAFATPAIVTQHARQMRHALTPSEQRLWLTLRGGALGVWFRRQVPLGRFIGDFVAVSARLVVEVDGGSHARRCAADARRDRELQRLGNRVLRLDAALVSERIEEATAQIRALLGAVARSGPAPRLCKVSMETSICAPQTPPPRSEAGPTFAHCEGERRLMVGARSATGVRITIRIEGGMRSRGLAFGEPSSGLMLGSVVACSSPSSARRRRTMQPDFLRRGRDSNPRYPFEYT